MLQGTRVAIKKVTVKKKLDINNQLLWEIKQVYHVSKHIFLTVQLKIKLKCIINILVLTALLIATRFRYGCLNNHNTHIMLQLIAEHKRVGVFQFRGHVPFGCFIGDFMITFSFVCVARLLQKKIL